MGSLEEKKQIVEQIKERFDRAQSVVILENRGLTVAQATDLRARLRDAGVDFKVLKNTLVKRAADETGITGLDPLLQGPTVWAFSLDDAVAAPKVLLEFTRTNDKLAVKGGILEKKIITEDGIKALAELPSREVLLAQVLGAFQSPLAGMANVLQGPLRKFGYALEALRKAREGA
ncbi:MAG: 50S ribosomal protein L10 [Peptococcaceae bacterium]|nr:50S ribosomal protein L10 [Peptococcaceae bacterium]MDH7526496.1 50S ribosomal protein L10 [Peptococcaceae bacterium]